MMSGVSIVIPTFNRRMSVERAIFSALEQDAQICEILVVDDASTDGTGSIVRSICDRHPKVKYTRLAKKRGGQYARLVGIHAAHGSWVAFLDSDDELIAGSIRIRLEVACANPDVGLVYGDVVAANSSNVPVRFHQLNGLAQPWLFHELSLCPYSAMMVRRNCFEVAGLPDADFPAWQDDDMVLTIGRIFPVLHCGSVVATMHRVDASISCDLGRKAEGCRRLVRKYKKDILIWNGWRSYILWQLRIWRAAFLAAEAKLQVDEGANSGNGSLMTFRRGRRLLRLAVTQLALRILYRVLRPQFQNLYG